MTRKSPIQIKNRDELLRYLTDELGYCGCGFYDESIRTLNDVLQLASNRQNSTGDSEQFSAITREVDVWLLSSPGLSTWFVWLLDKHDFIWHGFNASDIWITKKGVAVLEAIKLYYVFREVEE